MKSKYPFLILFFILLSVSLFCIVKEENVPVNEDAFSLKNEDRLDRILLYKKGLPRGGFIKNYDGSWELNQTVKVDKKMGDLLIHVLKNIRVKSPVAAEERDEVKEQLKKEGIIIEYFEEKYLNKAMYISSSPDPAYSYAMLEGNDVPYLIYISDTKRNLVDLVSLPELNWKERTLFNNNSEDILSVQIEYFDSPKDSFKVSKKNEKLVLNGISKLNILKVRDFLGKFEKIRAGAFISENSILLDSIKISEPYCRITLEDNDANKNRILTLYLDNQNKDLLYAQASHNEKEIFLIPVKSLQSILVKKSELLGGNS
ncbi:MAG TPA: hypothetical protein VD908_15615 [Cytophagales bacterium]|nr:hypothetical protein [Cytophagales bacterium]